MRRRTWGVAGLLVGVAALWLALWGAPVDVARGKGAQQGAPPDPQAALAERLALADSRVVALTAGQRTELFAVLPVGAQLTAAARGCLQSDCRQVMLYDWEAAATITVLVDVRAAQVLDVLHQPGTRPPLPDHLAARALEIALSAPEVIAVLGERRANADWAPMDSSLVGSVCERGHACVAPTFRVGSFLLWAIVDLTDERLLATRWTAIGPGAAQPVPFPDGYRAAREAACAATPGAVTRDGWQVAWETTPSDGFRVYDVSFQGTPLLHSATLAEWHADYGLQGYQDGTGCGGGQGFIILPYGDSRVLPLHDEADQPIGFELVQDFRMDNWGSLCGYRYEQRYQFFRDGRYRVLGGAFGKGCATNQIYRPLLRLDVALGGDSGDHIQRWDGQQWIGQSEEIKWTPADIQPQADGSGWRIRDDAGLSYRLVPGAPGEANEVAFLYALRHQPAEGESDLGVFTAGCCNDSEHGPEVYLNGEDIAGQNLVLWYVASLQTRSSAPDYACWTVSGEPNPESYPCWAGPTFVPSISIQSEAEAAQVGSPITFAPTFELNEGAELLWDFGDGRSALGSTVSHRYSQVGPYEVTLTVLEQQTVVGSYSTFLTVAPSSHFLPLLLR